PICRVCRGEATAEEPLFYPCRCSGSIKYVHQDCLEEWLAHSNKRYCELCKHEYAFTPVYDPNMPETIPKSIIVRQMVSNVSRTILVTTRAALVMVVWFLVLPYIVYWMTRFYFWSGGQTAAVVAGGGGDTSNSNNAAEAVLSAVGSASVRFVGFSSWHEWYEFALVNNTTTTPIVSRTGVLDGAANTALMLYTLTRLVIKPSSQMLSNALGVRVSDEWIDGAVDSVAELTAKCIEGGVVTVITIVLFMALFILRDWIYANAPVLDNLVDEAVVEGQMPEAQVLEPEPELPPPNVVHAQPVVVENPHYRPVFERLALVDDHLPDEQPIRRHSININPPPDPSTRGVAYDTMGFEYDEYADEAENAWSLVSSNESSSHGTTFMPHDEETTPPPTFTSESSRGITANIGFHPRDDQNSDHGNGDGIDAEDTRWLDELRQRLRHERHGEPADVGVGLQPNPRPEEDDNVQEAVQPEVAVAAEPVAAEAADNDDNFIDAEMGEGMLEAMGFRGRVMDAVQYFVLVLSMVSLVLACLAW
ncbi:hypothetical protein FBU31_006391, partial [Coemansia sp. 'formosensis']